MHPFLASQINQPTRFTLPCHPQTRLVSNDEFPTSSSPSGSGGDATVGWSTFIPEIGGDGDSGERGDNSRERRECLGHQEGLNSEMSY